MGVENAIMVRYANQPMPPYEPHAREFASARRLLWSVVGESGRTDPDEPARVAALARCTPDLCGVMMDDFFIGKDPANPAMYTTEQLAWLRGQLAASGRELPIWVVLYEWQLKLPVAQHLALCDVVTLWTWRAKNIPALQDNLKQVEQLAPAQRKVIGLYMWDYGEHKPMPLELMQRQCDLSLRWLKEGRIDGMILLATCICDLGLDAVEWSRRWVAEVGDQAL